MKMKKFLGWESGAAFLSVEGFVAAQTINSLVNHRSRLCKHSCFPCGSAVCSFSSLGALGTGRVILRLRLCDVFGNMEAAGELCQKCLCFRLEGISMDTHGVTEMYSDWMRIGDGLGTAAFWYSNKCLATPRSLGYQLAI